MGRKSVVFRIITDPDRAEQRGFEHRSTALAELGFGVNTSTLHFFLARAELSIFLEGTAGDERKLIAPAEGYGLCCFCLKFLYLFSGIFGQLPTIIFNS